MSTEPDTSTPTPDYPTRRSLRAATPRRRQRVARTRKRPAPEAEPRRRGKTSARLVALMAVPALVVPIVMPAFALTPSATVSEAEELAQAAAAAQSLQVNSGGLSAAVSRDDYTAQAVEQLGYDLAPAEGRRGYATPADTGWWRPVPGPFTSEYGPRRLICNASGCSSPFHQGIDFGDPCGTPIRAINAGVVTFVGNGGAFGQRVIIDHGNGINSYYGHIETGSFLVTEGEEVDGGQSIAGVGDTGVVTGCHLDLKITIDGDNTDPEPFLTERGVWIR